MNPRTTHTLGGIVLGLIGSLISFGVYAYAFTAKNGVSFDMFWENWVVDSDVFRTEIITATVLLNIILFFILYRTKKEAMATGVLIAVMVTLVAAFAFFL